MNGTMPPDIPEDYYPKGWSSFYVYHSYFALVSLIIALNCIDTTFCPLLSPSLICRSCYLFAPRTKTVFAQRCTLAVVGSSSLPNGLPPANRSKILTGCL